MTPQRPSVQAAAPQTLCPTSPTPARPQNQLGLRTLNLLVGWGTVGLVYFLSAQLQRQGTVLPPSFVDAWLAFSPLAIWPYLSFFLLIPLAYFGCPLKRLKPLRQATQLCALVAGAVYLIYPTTMAYPTLVEHSVSAQLLALLHRLDSAQNCLPSLHMALTVLAAWALSARHKPIQTAVVLLWAVAIAVSIVQLRRHLFIDLVAGALLAGVAIWLCSHVRSVQASAASSPFQGAAMPRHTPGKD